MKSTWLDNSLRVNTAIFSYEYDNLAALEFVEAACLPENVDTLYQALNEELLLGYLLLILLAIRHRIGRGPAQRLLELTLLLDASASNARVGGFVKVRITTDQHHYSALGQINPRIRTPHLDRLARTKEGADDD